jgi:hypothetical protein
MGARFRLRAAHARGRQPVLSYFFRAFARSFLLPPPREAERRLAQTKGHRLAKAPRRPLARQARLPALHRGDFSRDHRASSPDRRTTSSRYPGSACALPFIQASPSHSRQPPHRGRTVTAPPGTGVRLPACRRRHPRSANWPSPEDALGERGRCTPYVKWGRCQIRTLRLQGPSTLRPELRSGAHEFEAHPLRQRPLKRLTN